PPARKLRWAGPAAPPHQLQPHRLAVAARRIELPRLPRAHPQATRRRSPPPLPLRLEDGVSHGQLTQPPLRSIRLLPGVEGPLGIFLDLMLLPLTHTHAYTRPRTGQQLLDLLRRQQRTTPAG